VYGREQLEQDLMWLETQRAEGARMLVGGKINGFQKLALDQEIDAAERKCRGKLAGVRMAITDRETMIRSGKLRYWKRSKGKLLIRSHGTDAPWRFTTQAALDGLRAAGYFLVELKSFPPRNGEATPGVGDDIDAASPLPSKREVSVEEARKLMEEGCQIIWRPDGRECALVVECA
jgi:hypothetical protein